MILLLFVPAWWEHLGIPAECRAPVYLTLDWSLIFSCPAQESTLQTANWYSENFQQWDCPLLNGNYGSRFIFCLCPSDSFSCAFLWATWKMVGTVNSVSNIRGKLFRFRHILWFCSKVLRSVRELWCGAILRFNMLWELNLSTSTLEIIFVLETNMEIKIKNNFFLQPRE